MNDRKGDTLLHIASFIHLLIMALICGIVYEAVKANPDIRILLSLIAILLLASAAMTGVYIKVYNSKPSKDK